MTTAPTDQGWVADDREFGARLALIRQRMAWGNVKEAALACGVPVESWRNWERDGRLPRDLMTITAKIAARTGCDQAWLAGFNQRPGGTSLIRWLRISAGERAAHTSQAPRFADLVEAA